MNTNNMKRRLFLCLALIGAFAIGKAVTLGDGDTPTASADLNLVVWHKDGSKVLFKLSEKPKVIYGDSLVTIQAATMVEYAFQAIQKMTFESEEVVGIKEMKPDPERPFLSDGETVTFLPADKDLRVTIVQLNGIVVKDIAVRRGQQSSLSLRSLPAGVYLLNVNGITYKIKTR
jgi:hypothetical protein